VRPADGAVMPGSGVKIGIEDDLLFYRSQVITAASVNAPPKPKIV
jgi:hypothetical protein